MRNCRQESDFYLILDPRIKLIWFDKSGTWDEKNLNLPICVDGGSHRGISTNSSEVFTSCAMCAQWRSASVTVGCILQVIFSVSEHPCLQVQLLLIISTWPERTFWLLHCMMEDLIVPLRHWLLLHLVIWFRCLVVNWSCVVLKSGRSHNEGDRKRIRG